MEMVYKSIEGKKQPKLTYVSELLFTYCVIYAKSSNEYLNH